MLGNLQATEFIVAVTTARFSADVLMIDAAPVSLVSCLRAVRLTGIDQRCPNLDHPRKVIEDLKGLETLLPP